MCFNDTFSQAMLNFKPVILVLIFSFFFVHLFGQDFFSEYPNNRIVLEATAPGDQYQYDIGEKDKFYHKSASALVFNKVIIETSESKRRGLRLKFTFSDGIGNKIICDETNIMKLIPKIDCSGEMIYPEILSEEFNRFGVQFRGWRDEYTIIKADNIKPEYSEALDRVYRVQLVNNCLEPGKWEVVIDSEDYSDFPQRRKSDNNLNQRRILAHSWFNLPMDIYKTLLKINNPELETNLVDLGYNELVEISEKTPVDFGQLREPLDEKLDIKVVEIGHQSKRVIEILDPEEYYKKKFGLVLSEDNYTYESILNQRLPLTRFQDRGFYSKEKADSFYVQWMKQVDKVEINTIDVHDAGVISEIKLTGENAPYEIVLGNVDLALMNEQILCGFLFGVNTYITNVRNNSRPNTIGYDPTQYPSYRRPYLYLIDKKTGNWVNNQFKGVEKVYLSYDDIDRKILNIYVLSYERIIPVWMARVRLPDDFVEQIRVRRRLFNY